MENFIALMAKAVFLNVGECRCDVQQKVSLKNLEFYPDACEELNFQHVDCRRLQNGCQARAPIRS